MRVEGGRGRSDTEGGRGGRSCIRDVRSRIDRSFVGGELREDRCECSDPPPVESFEGARVYDEAERSLARRFGTSKRSE